MSDILLFLWDSGKYQGTFPLFPLLPSLLCGLSLVSNPERSVCFCVSGCWHYRHAWLSLASLGSQYQRVNPPLTGRISLIRLWFTWCYCDSPEQCSCNIVTSVLRLLNFWFSGGWDGSWCAFRTQPFYALWVLLCTISFTGLGLQIQIRDFCKYNCLRRGHSEVTVGP